MSEVPLCRGTSLIRCAHSENGRVPLNLRTFSKNSRAPLHFVFIMPHDEGTAPPFPSTRSRVLAAVAPALRGLLERALKARCQPLRGAQDQERREWPCEGAVE